MKFGICTEGTEEAFENALRERAKPDKPFVYLEIGVAQCETFQTVCLILGTTGAYWRAIAIDPASEARDAFTRRISAPCPAHLINTTREEAFRNPESRISIGNSLNFVFIDGCHAEPCVTGDFMYVEPLVVSGGLVVFHDFGTETSGLQPHCQKPLAVREAVEALGLRNDSRLGWRRLPDWVGDKTKKGATCGVFEKA